jgi:hypothetical protein|tara:strand:+ start:1202 stop:1615 length:414 start_codon:yes stop_codon:yes gene_type:complete
MIYDHFIDRLKDKWDEDMADGWASKKNCWAFFERYYRVIAKSVVIAERKLEHLEVSTGGLSDETKNKLREIRTDLRNAVWFSAFDRPKPTKRYSIKSLFDGLINWKQVYEHHHFFDDIEDGQGKPKELNESRRQVQG